MDKSNNLNKGATILSKFFIAVLLACPLYVWGKKIKVSKDKEKIELDEWLSTLKKKDKEKVTPLLAAKKSGQSILILGSFCPLFWFSLIAGQSKRIILFNLAHSVIYIILGYYMTNKAKKNLVLMKDGLLNK